MPATRWRFLPQKLQTSLAISRIEVDEPGLFAHPLLTLAAKVLSQDDALLADQQHPFRRAPTMPAP
jgi:hypothetical protein